MKSAETCSCSLCNKFYTYLYHHIVVLDKYIHSNLVYYKHSEDDEPYDYGNHFEDLSVEGTITLNLILIIQPTRRTIFSNLFLE